MPTILRRLLLLLALLVGGPAAAATQPTALLCPAPPPPPPGLPAPVAASDTRLHLEAARSETDRDGSTLLDGDVQATQGERTFRADHVTYSKGDGRVRADGNLAYRDPFLTLTGTHADVDLANDHGRFDDAVFSFNQRFGRGHATSLATLDKWRADLTSVVYTGCPEGREDWTLQASRMHIDQQTGKGVANDVWIKFQGVPLFYTPWLQFPVDERRMTGLLPPQISSSTRHGFEFMLPLYWNIAPEQDATITLHPMSTRGVMLENEFRYLTAGSSGTVELDYLNDDKVTGEQRARARYRDRTALTPDWTLDVDLAAVSDPRYFEDFGSSLVATTQSYLPRRIDLLTSGVHYAFRARLLDYQVTDPTLTPVDRPYGKLPQLSLVASSEKGGYGLVYDLASELVHFQHDVLVEGTRFDLKPRVSLPLRSDGWFVTPALAWRYTAYQLTGDPSFPSSVTRSLPIESLDAGLLFERDVDWHGGLIQTLEPRLYYLKVPFRDQTDIPLFDTAIPDINVYQLFSDNRFIGADRQGDANQLSAAVTSRLLDPNNGRELLEATVGQITYFADRQVTLGPAPAVLSRSEVVAEVSTDVTAPFSVAAGTVYDPSNSAAARSDFSLRWRPEARERVDFSYRFRRGSLEQTDLAVAWPLSSHWRAIARWNYSVLDGSTLESLAAFEYESCCWALRFGSRQYVFNRTGQKDRTIFLQLELKGLARVGEPIEQLLERGTTTYGIPENL